VALGSYQKDVKSDDPPVVSVKNIIFSNVTPCSQVEFTDVSEEHTASIFRVQ
jgi:hypothetical protein